MQHANQSVGTWDSQQHPPWPPVSAVALPPHPACVFTIHCISHYLYRLWASMFKPQITILWCEGGLPHLHCCCWCESIKRWWRGPQKLFDQWGRTQGVLQFDWTSLLRGLIGLPHLFSLSLPSLKPMYDTICWLAYCTMRYHECLHVWYYLVCVSYAFHVWYQSWSHYYYNTRYWGSYDPYRLSQ